LCTIIIAFLGIITTSPAMAMSEAADAANPST